ncbi:hypothetical protein RI129_007350 [Pyrocoelia pectoralis]|uniref:Uncharacterized protein n=1 Tax=Pyrocoelia pectoralis TaxID=417401 RepID=A0AAN7ZET6_9COLE
MRDKDQLSPHSSRSESKSPISEEAEKKRKRSVSNESKSSGSKSRSRSRSYSSDRDGYRLHIADIGDHVRRSDLEKVFAPFGNLKELWLTHSSPIFGFAVFKTKESSIAALKGADGVNVGGSRIRVTHARPRTRGQGRRFFHPNMRCYQCGYAGHFYRDCPDLDDSKGYDSRSARRNSRRDRDRDYYSDRDYGRRRQRSSRRYDDYDGYRRSGGRRYRY